MHRLYDLSTTLAWQIQIQIQLDALYVVRCFRFNRFAQMGPIRFDRGDFPKSTNKRNSNNCELRIAYCILIEIDVSYDNKSEQISTNCLGFQLQRQQQRS